MKKFLIVSGCLVGIVVLLIAGVMAFMLFLSSTNNAYKGDYTNVIESTSTNSVEKKALVVYQPSRSKEFSEIANQLAKGLSESGYDVTLSYPGKHLSTDVSKYSVLAFGSPIYMGQPSTALTDYMKEIKDIYNKKVIAFAIGSLESELEFEIYQKSLNNAKIDKKVKFIAKDKSDEDAAYKLGLETGKK